MHYRSVRDDLRPRGGLWCGTAGSGVIATDPVGNRALEAGREVGDPIVVDVDGPERSRRFVRRTSCCLIYVATELVPVGCAGGSTFTVHHYGGRS